MTQPPMIAVLDDEPEMRKALRRLLLTHGYRVVLHARGEDLLESLSTTHPDCILLDLHMQGITGFDVLAVLAGRGNSTPIVVLTGHDEPDTAERVQRLGVAAYLRKPVDETTLLAALAAATALRPFREAIHRERTKPNRN